MSRRISLLLIAMFVLVVMMFAVNPGFATEAKAGDDTWAKAGDSAWAKAGDTWAKAE